MILLSEQRYPQHSISTWRKLCEEAIMHVITPFPIAPDIASPFTGCRSCVPCAVSSSSSDSPVTGCSMDDGCMAHKMWCKCTSVQSMSSCGPCKHPGSTHVSMLRHPCKHAHPVAHVHRPNRQTTTTLPSGLYYFPSAHVAMPCPQVTIPPSLSPLPPSLTLFACFKCALERVREMIRRSALPMPFGSDSSDWPACAGGAAFEGVGCCTRAVAELRLSSLVVTMGTGANLFFRSATVERRWGALREGVRTAVGSIEPIRWTSTGSDSVSMCACA